MNTLLDDDEVVEPEQHEVTLGTGTILGIFLGLALLCGLFFGFGYKIGSHTAAVPGQVVADSSPAPAANFGSFKPAAGSPADGGGAAPANANPSSPSRREAARLKKDETETASETAANGEKDAAAPAVGATSGDSGWFVVQVAAVSHPEDAQLLVSALRAKGYPVSAHTMPQDKFFHIQVGPFSTHKDADAARQRLVADGYQPIMK